jgi:protein-disulfide isomerase
VAGPDPDSDDRSITIRVRRSHLWGVAGLALGLIAGLVLGRVTADDNGGERPVLYGVAPAGSSQDPAAGESTAPVKVDTAGSPARGPERAKVTMVEFVDFECPFCGRYARDTYPRVEREYGDRVRYVSRQFPLESHPHARHAAEAAECAGAQGRYWEYHRVLFDNQDALGVPALRRHARSVGLDVRRWESCLDSSATRRAIDRDVGDGRRYGVTGTPTFFINGRPVRGAQSFEAIKAQLDEALRR